MLVWNSCVSDSRVIKEAESVARAGHDVTVFCLQDGQAPNTEARNGVTYRRLRRPSAWQPNHRVDRHPVLAVALRVLLFVPWQICRFYRFLNKDGRLVGDPQVLRRLLFNAKGVLRSLYRRAIRGVGRRLIRRVYRAFAPLLFLWEVRKTYTTAIRQFAPHIVHSHDLITLPASLPLSTQLSVPLIYDTHELALHVSNPPTGFRRWLYRRLETKAMANVSAVVTVSDSIARYLTKDYHIPLPTVIYNAPQMADGAFERTIRTDAQVGPETPLAVFVGGLSRHRGVDKLVEALAFVPDLHLALVGPRRLELDEELRQLAASRGLQERLRFLPGVPAESLTSYLSSADVSVIPYQNVCLNHEFCMPNKLFESSLAGLPLAVASLTDLKGFVEKHEIGLAMDETDPGDIAKTIEAILGNPGRYASRGEKLERLVETYAWGVQERKLHGLYDRLLPAA